MDHITYQWRLNGIDIPGATGSDYWLLDASVANTGTYTVKVTDPNGKFLISNEAVVGLAIAAPSITSQPKSVSVAAGGSFTLSVGATGTGLSYQWKFQGANITGATLAAYTKTAVTAADAGSYTVTISNAGGSVTSNDATVTIGNGGGNGSDGSGGGGGAPSYLFFLSLASIGGMRLCQSRIGTKPKLL